MRNTTSGLNTAAPGIRKDNSVYVPDPRVIFALVTVFSTYGILIRDDVIAMGSLLVMVFIVSSVLKVDISRIFKMFKIFWQILIPVMLLRSLFTPSGIVLFEIGNVPLLTTGGLAMGLLVVFRLTAFIMCASMFTLYSTRELIQAIVQIKMPYEIAYMVFIGLRFVPKFSEEMKDSLIALQLRGVIIEKMKLGKRLALYKYLLLPSIVSSLQRAKELVMSMDMRAFRAMKYRTSYFTLILNKWDKFILIMILLAAAGLGFVFFRFNFYYIIMDGRGLN